MRTPCVSCTQRTASNTFRPRRSQAAPEICTNVSFRTPSARATEERWPSRRATLTSIAVIAATLQRASAHGASVDAPAASIQLDLAPDQSKYDPTDERLRSAARLLQDALDAKTLQEEEMLWTRIIDEYGSLPADWVPDVVGRALGNRGNARSRRGDLMGALKDYNASIKLCPWSVDPVLNRGVALEALGRWDEAIRDYRAILKVAPLDPAGWNNLGNAAAGKGRWDEAERYYARAAALSPEYAFATANRACALYQLGETEEATRLMRTLLRRYPEFPDMRAALTVALWGSGRETEAEEEWLRMDDTRYADTKWLTENRRWPPKLVEGMEAFLAVKSVV